MANEQPQNPAGEAKTSFLHIKATPRDKTAWVRAAQRNRQKLEAWATETLNEKAKEGMFVENEQGDWINEATGEVVLKREPLKLPRLRDIGSKT